MKNKSTPIWFVIILPLLVRAFCTAFCADSSAAQTVNGGALIDGVGFYMPFVVTRSNLPGTSMENVRVYIQDEQITVEWHSGAWCNAKGMDTTINNVVRTITPNVTGKWDSTSATTYSAGYGSVKSGIWPNYSFKADTAVIMSVQRAADSITALKAMKVSYTDTGSMLAGYPRTSTVMKYIDTVSFSGRVNMRVKYTDTTSMLLPYSRSATAMKYTDTVSLSNRINAKLNTADTATMLNPYARIASTMKYTDTISLSNRLNSKINYPTPVSATRSVTGTTYTISTTLGAWVSYTISISCTATIGSSSTGSVTLQYSTNAGTTWNDVCQIKNSNTVSLAIVLNSISIQQAPLSGFIPANALCRMVQSVAGTTSIAYIMGQESF